MADVFFETDGKEPFILASDHQVDVKAVEWRPNSGKMIAVGCRSVYRTL
jgi:aladin